jgi:hypothetical protein
MAKRRKKKSGLHKGISSVLKGVPIPQGVRNWRPVGKCATQRPCDSPEVPQPEVSSVFKGVSVPADGSARPPVGDHPQNSRAEASPADAPGGLRTSRRPIEQREYLEESPAKAGRTGEQTPAGRVVCYRDPAEEVPMLSLRQRMWEKLFGTKN